VLPPGKEQKFMIKAYGSEFDITEDAKNTIDSMNQYQLASQIRFSSVGNYLMCGANGEYLMARFRELGGMTPEISKRLG